ncbi:hypothetical protein GCK32_019165, partial [Trichostrongylus colubriformis]
RYSMDVRSLLESSLAPGSLSVPKVCCKRRGVSAYLLRYGYYPECFQCWERYATLNLARLYRRVEETTLTSTRLSVQCRHFCFCGWR